MTYKQHEIGRQGEATALQFLLQKKLRLIKQNYACKFGEIDLIMQHQNQLVFVEVRQRKSQAKVSSAISITPAKKRRLINSAFCYLQQHYHTDQVGCRFDVIAIDGIEVHWYCNAFTLDELNQY